MNGVSTTGAVSSIAARVPSRIISAALLAVAVLAVGVMRVPALANDEHVVIADNFQGLTLDTGRWNPAVGPHLPHSEDTSLPTQDKVSDGLHLTFQRIQPTNVYLSGEIYSVASFLYGHVDVIARLPHANGMVPGIWLENFDARGAINGEIDILEGFGSRPYNFQSTVHHWTHGTEPPPSCIQVGWVTPGSLCTNPSKLPVQDYSAAFHDFGMDWEPGKVTFLMDGVPYWTCTKGIPSTPMDLVLGLAVGYFWDGYPDASTPNSASFDVQSVRVTSAN